jgi:glutathione peroxidase
MDSLYDIAVETIDGRQVTLGDYAGKVLLIVNTASKCGFTPQFAGLEALYQRFKDKDFVVLGFPCNQFGLQEPGSNDQIADFCQKNYGVSFPMFAKVEVNGGKAHPLFKLLTDALPGMLGTSFVKWNFTKFLIDSSGRPIERYAPKTTPEELVEAIEPLL